MLARTSLGLVLVLSVLWGACDVKFVRLTLVNDSSFKICEVYASDSGAEEWGQDELGAYDISPNGSFDLMMLVGNYDLRIVHCDGQEGLLEGVDLEEDDELKYRDTHLLGAEPSEPEEED